MSSAFMWGSSPATPSAVVLIPMSLALARPGESGSTPTIHTGSITSERMAFINRSVPILPGPIMAALIFAVVISQQPSSGSNKFNGQVANARDRQRHGISGLDRFKGNQRARQNNVAGIEADIVL